MIKTRVRGRTVLFGAATLALVGCGDSRPTKEALTENPTQPPSTGDTVGEPLRGGCGVESSQVAPGVVPTAAASSGAELLAAGSAPAAAGPAVPVSVWLHVINKGPAETDGNVPDAKLDQMMSNLTTQFFAGSGGVAMPFFFSKVGVTRTTNANWFANGFGNSTQERAMKSALRVGGPRTLNVFIVGPMAGQPLNNGTFPSQYTNGRRQNGSFGYDGVLLGAEVVAEPRNSTFAHEVGHWVELAHTHDTGCSAPDDWVPDTPRHTLNQQCAMATDTCPSDPGLDPVRNFMVSVVPDDCRTEFTPGQVSRALLAHRVYRKRPTDGIALVGRSEWTTLPYAWMRKQPWNTPFDEFSISNGDVGSFQTWAATAGTQKLAGDFDGDGLTDLAVTGPSGWATIGTTYARGDGTFETINVGVGSDFPFHSSRPGVTRLVGDFDGDGHDDVALTGVTAWLFIPVAYGGTRGLFVADTIDAFDFGSWSAQSGVRRVAGDFNADGISDIALVGGPDWTSIPVASGTFDRNFSVNNEFVPNFSTWARQPGATPLTGDFDGNGATDIALVGGTGWQSIPVVYSLGKGSTNIGKWFEVNAGVGPLASVTEGSQVSHLVGDFDGDGRDDIAVTGGSGWNTLPVFFAKSFGFDPKNLSSPDFATKNFPSWAAQAGVSRIVGDFNDDGLADIALVGGNGWTGIRVAFSNGDGTFRVADLNVTATGFNTKAALSSSKLGGYFKSF